MPPNTQTYYFDAPRETKRRREPRLALENQALPLLEPATPTLAVSDKEQEQGKEAAAEQDKEEDAKRTD